MDENVREADCAVEQCHYGKVRALLDAVALARVFEVLDHRVMADAKDTRNLPVGLAACRPKHAIALPIGHGHRGLRCAPRLGNAPGGFKG